MGRKRTTGSKGVSSPTPAKQTKADEPEMSEEGASASGDRFAEKARYFYVTDSTPKDGTIRVDDKEYQEWKPDKIRKFISDNNLRHGDIVNFSGYRDVGSVIIYQNSQNKMSWIENEDESGSGYLTIPGKVLQYTDNAIEKYKDILKEQNCVNMHVHNTEKYLTDKLGEIPEGWEFDITFTMGDFENLAVTPPETGIECRSFESLDGRTWADIAASFSPAGTKMAKFRLKVALAAEKLQEYKTKYGDPNKKYAWMNAGPRIPKTWNLERGAGSSGANEHTFTWKLEGPETDMDQVKELLRDWLEGFKWEYIDE